MEGDRGPAVAVAPLRRALVALMLAVAAFVAACGGDERPQPRGALRQALAYLPADAAVAVAVRTDPDSPALRPLSRGNAGRSVLATAIGVVAGRRGRELAAVARRQAGDPLAIALGATAEPLASLRIRSPRLLRQGIERRVRTGAARRLDGEGDLRWREGRGEAAVFAALDGRMLVLAGSEADLDESLGTAAGDESLAFRGSFAGRLERARPQDLLRAAGDGRRLIEATGDEAAAELARIPWLAALGDLDAAGTVQGRELRVAVVLRSDRRRLRYRDLPLPAGPRRALLYDRRAPAVIAVREPLRLARFAERVAAVTNPEGYEQYRAALAQLRGLFGVDLHRDLLARIDNLSIALRPGGEIAFKARIERSEVGRVGRALERARPALEVTLAGLLSGISVDARGPREWTVRRRGATLARYALRGTTLVGTIGGAELPSTAGRPASTGLDGALALRGDLDRIGAVAGSLLDLPTIGLPAGPGLGTARAAARIDLRALRATILVPLPR